LLKILKHYNVTPKPDIEQPELAILTATAFDNAKLSSEEATVLNFQTKYCHEEKNSSGKKKSHVRSINREQLDSEPARPGEQVAAKVSNTGENGSWILGNVLDYDPTNQAYELQDEDDANRVIYLNYGEVKRLEDSAAHLHRGDDVLAVFPETTSFYRAIVAKNPRPPQHGNNGWDIVVRFEDDEDDSGRAPPRRVPARFVLRRSDIGDDSPVYPMY
jgi:hypothetical protein